MKWHTKDRQSYGKKNRLRYRRLPAIPWTNLLYFSCIQLTCMCIYCINVKSLTLKLFLLWPSKVEVSRRSRNSLVPKLIVLLYSSDQCKQTGFLTYQAGFSEVLLRTLMLKFKTTCSSIAIHRLDLKSILNIIYPI